MASQAVRFDAEGDKYSITSAGFGGADQDFTVCLWAYPVNNRGYYQIPWSVDAGHPSYVQVGTNFDGVWLRAFGSGAAGIDGPNPIAFATWTFIALSHTSSGGDTLYWAELGDASLSSNDGDIPDAVTTNTLYLGGNGQALNEWFDGRIAAVKMWHAALDAAELDAERFSYQPARLEDLWANWTFWNGPQTADESGNGHTLTAGTAPTAEAGPPGIPLAVPPGGFKVGKIWDDENGVDLINIGPDGFTELEWNLQVVPPAVGEDVYEFRVYAGATPLDAYTVTPQFQVTTETVWTYYGPTPIRRAYMGTLPVAPYAVTAP